MPCISVTSFLYVGLGLATQPRHDTILCRHMDLTVNALTGGGPVDAERQTRRQALGSIVRWSAAGLGAAGLLSAFPARVYFDVCNTIADRLSRPIRTPITVDPCSISCSYRNVEFRSRSDHLRLRGWLFTTASPAPPSHRQCITLVHGWGGNRAYDNMPDVARTLLADGYDVLTFDLRSCGESEGDRFTLGNLEQLDILGAHDFLTRSGYTPANVGWLGFSMGAAALLAVSPKLPQAAIIADSGFAELRPLLDAELTAYSGVPGFFNPGVEMASALYGIDAGLRPVAAIAAQPHRRFLFVMGTLDQIVPPKQAFELLHADASLASELPDDAVQTLSPTARVVTPHQAPWRHLLVVDGADHGHAGVIDPTSYGAEILGFLRATMPPITA